MQRTILAIVFGVVLKCLPALLSTAEVDRPALSPVVGTPAALPIVSQKDEADATLPPEPVPPVAVPEEIVTRVTIEPVVDPMAGLHRYTLVAVTMPGDAGSRQMAANVLADLIDSHWAVVTVSPLHPLAAGHKAGTLIAYDGATVRGFGAPRNPGSAKTFVTKMYAPELSPKAAAPPQPWELSSLKHWLAEYADNGHKGTTPVENMTVAEHLTQDHGFAPRLVRQLSAEEQQLAHDAAHDGLIRGDGYRDNPLAKPTQRMPPRSMQQLRESRVPKAATHALPPRVIYRTPANCPNGRCPNVRYVW